MNILFRILVVTAIAVLPYQSAAQVPETEQAQTSWWVNIGLNNAGEISANINRTLLWGVRAAYVGDVGVPGGPIGDAPPCWDVGFLIGDEWHNKWISTSAAVGIALTVVPRQTEPKLFTAGIPFELHGVVRPSSFVGLGIGFLGNLNLEKSFSQLVFTIRFGSF